MALMLSFGDGKEVQHAIEALTQRLTDLFKKKKIQEMVNESLF